MVVAREMGMSEDEFFHSCPVFFNEVAEKFYEKKTAEMRMMAQIGGGLVGG